MYVGGVERTGLEIALLNGALERARVGLLVTVDARLSRLLEGRETIAMLQLRLGMTRSLDIDTSAYRMMVHDRRLIVLNTSHRLAGSKLVANRREFGLVDALDVLYTRCTRNIAGRSVVSVLHLRHTVVIDTLLITLRLESVKASKFSTKLSVL
jgi:hypothetical protein